MSIEATLAGDEALESSWLLVSIGVSVLLAVLPTTALYLGQRKIGLDGGALAFLVALVVLAPGWAALVVLGYRIARELRPGRLWYQSLVNVAVTIIPGAVVAITLCLVHGAHALGAQPAAWPYIAGAAVLDAAVNLLLLDAVLSQLIDRPLSMGIHEDAPPTLVMTGLTIGMTLLLLAVWDWPRVGLALVPVVGLLVLRESKRSASARTQTDALERLDRASRPVVALAPLEVFAEVADRATELFGSQAIEVRLDCWPPAGDQHVFRRAPGEADRWEPTGADPEPDLEAHRAPLLVGDELLGAMLLSLGHEPDQTEQHVVNTFAATVAAAASHAASYAAQRHAARHDPLTGLLNRLGLAEEVALALAGGAPTVAGGRRSRSGDGGVTALLLLDLDHFKEVNDTLGHESGDRLLIEVGRRLEACVREHDVVARLGGDEFAIVLRGLGDVETAVVTGESLLARLIEPIELDGLRLPLEGSIGVAVAAAGGGDAASEEGLLRCADIAMYEAKRRRNSVIRYHPSQDTTSPERLALIGQLQTGIRAGELRLHYQPKVQLSDGRVTGAEALVRWQHPERGLLGPGAFIPAVERTGMVLELTLEVLDQAVREAAEWHRSRPADSPAVIVAVNVSRRCLVHREFPQDVAAVLIRHGLPGACLTLEITETLELAELEVVEDVLTRLRDLGAHLSVDDFGTGYSSMSFFQRVDVDEVKIDGSFVQAMERSSSARAIVCSTLELGHGVGLPVVAEGVETAEQLGELMAIGCDMAQGFFLGHPVPAAELRAQLWRANPQVIEALRSRLLLPLQVAALS